MKYLPVRDCKKGHVYRIHSRNLGFGVFVPEKDNGFLGVREKGGSLYLFNELHADTGGIFGTVRPLEDLGPLKDPKILLSESMPSLCSYCGERCAYIEVEGGVQKGDQSYSGEWRHLSGDGRCNEVHPEGSENHKLFQAMLEIEREHGDGVYTDFVWVLMSGTRDADNDPWIPDAHPPGSGVVVAVFRQRGELIYHMDKSPPVFEDNLDMEWTQPKMLKPFWTMGPINQAGGYRWATGTQMRLK